MLPAQDTTAGKRQSQDSSSSVSGLERLTLLTRDTTLPFHWQLVGGCWSDRIPTQEDTALKALFFNSKLLLNVLWDGQSLCL